MNQNNHSSAGNRIKSQALQSNPFEYLLQNTLQQKLTKKKQLFQEYQQSTNIKKKRSQTQKLQELQQQKQFVRRSNLHNQFMSKREHQRRLLQQKQVAEHYQRTKQLNKINQQRQREDELKWKNIMQNKKSVDKKALFQEFFNNYQLSSRQNQKNHLQNIIKFKKQDFQKYRIVQNGIIDVKQRQRTTVRNSLVENQRKKQQMRESLIKQQQKKQIQKKQTSLRRYQSQKNIDPIKNKDFIIKHYRNSLNPLFQEDLNPQNRYEKRRSQQTLDGRVVYNKIPEKINHIQPSQSLGIKSREMSSLAKNGSKVFL